MAILMNTRIRKKLQQAVTRARLAEARAEEARAEEARAEEARAEEEAEWFPVAGRGDAISLLEWQTEGRVDVDAVFERPRVWMNLKKRTIRACGIVVPMLEEHVTAYESWAESDHRCNDRYDVGAYLWALQVWKECRGLHAHRHSTGGIPS